MKINLDKNLEDSIINFLNSLEKNNFEYFPVLNGVTKSGIDLRDIKNKKTGQTAYDRMRELVGVVKIRY